MMLFWRSSLAFLAIIVALSAASGGHAATADLYAFGDDPRQDFIAFDPNYPKVHDALSTELDGLQVDMIRQQRAGRKTYCSREVFLEYRSLVDSTCR